MSRPERKILETSIVFVNLQIACTFFGFINPFNGDKLLGCLDNFK